MIFFEKVSKFFGQKKAVDEISFRINKKEVIGFLGPNGAGKTTTMRLLLGYLAPTKGRIFINAREPKKDRVKINQNIGYLPENNPLYPEMTVEEYLGFIGGIKNDHQWSSVINQVDLSEVLKNKIESLSRGFKQRVGLAAALIGNPEILVLDEPTSGLDPLEQEKIKKLIKGLKKIIIFSTHILSEVEDVADRLIIINQGKIVYDDKKPKGKGAVEKLFKKVVKKIVYVKNSL